MNCATGLCAAISIWLGAHGYMPFQRDAVLRHIWLESRFEECAVNPHSGSRYLMQWDGSRLAWFHGQCLSWDQQMERADWELRNISAYGCFWRARTESEALKALRRGFGRGRC